MPIRNIQKFMVCHGLVQTFAPRFTKAAVIRTLQPLYQTLPLHPQGQCLPFPPLRISKPVETRDVESERPSPLD
jgi:hypothetical protein